MVRSGSPRGQANSLVAHVATPNPPSRTLGDESSLPSDFDFQVIGSSSKPREIAARLATLIPFGGGSIAAVSAELRTVWRQRVLDLRDGGWKFFCNPRWVNIARNCPPCGVRTKTHGWTCQQTVFCPYCWGRKIVFGAFDFLVRLLPAFAPLDAKLVCFECYDDLSSSEGSCNQFAFIRKAVPRFLSRRCEEFNLLRASAGIVCNRIWPSNGSLVFCRTGLLVCPRPVPLRRLGLPDDAVAVHSLPTSKELAGLVGRLLEFPVALLRCDPAVAIAVADTLRHVHLLSYYGRRHAVDES